MKKQSFNRKTTESLMLLLRDGFVDYTSDQNIYTNVNQAIEATDRYYTRGKIETLIKKNMVRTIKTEEGLKVFLPDILFFYFISEQQTALVAAKAAPKINPTPKIYKSFSVQQAEQIFNTLQSFCYKLSKSKKQEFLQEIGFI